MFQVKNRESDQLVVSSKKMMDAVIIGKYEIYKRVQMMLNGKVLMSPTLNSIEFEIRMKCSGPSMAKAHRALHSGVPSILQAIR